MNTFNTPLWNHLFTFDPLSNGIFSIAFTLLILFLFIYPSQRKKNGAIEKTFYLILPPLLFSMIVSFFTGSSLFSGITLIVVLMFHLKFTEKIENKDFVIISLQLIGLFMIFAILDSTLKLIILLILILKFFFDSAQEDNKEKHKVVL